MDNLRPYGPGKYETILDAVVDAAYGTLGHYTDTVGSVDELGHYTFIVAETTLWDELSSEVAKYLTAEELDYLRDKVACIIHEDSQGFVSINYYTNREVAAKLWRAILHDYTAWEEK